MFINAPPEACSVFYFSALSGVLQSEVFVGPQGSDNESLANVFVPGVSMSRYVVACRCKSMAVVIFLKKLWQM